MKIFMIWTANFMTLQIKIRKCLVKSASMKLLSSFPYSYEYNVYELQSKQEEVVIMQKWMKVVQKLGIRRRNGICCTLHDAY